MRPVVIRPVVGAERSDVVAFVRARWGTDRMVRRGEVVVPAELPAIVAVDGDELIGVAAFDVRGTRCELTLIDVVRRGEGIGTRLLAAVREEAERAGCTVLWVVTTNDNLDALAFYQRRGFVLTTLRPGAVDAARRHLKPEIPTVGASGIAIRDELELALDLGQDAGSDDASAGPGG